MQLSDTSAEVMGRLSAASMESYSRAYPHLVRLHMLQVTCSEQLSIFLTDCLNSTTGSEAKIEQRMTNILHVAGCRRRAMQLRLWQRAAWVPLRGSACYAGMSACASPSPPSAHRHAALRFGHGNTSMSPLNFTLHGKCKDRLSIKSHAVCITDEQVLESTNKLGLSG